MIVFRIALVAIVLVGEGPSALETAHPVTGPERLPALESRRLLYWLVGGIGLAAGAALLVLARRRQAISAPSAEEWAAKRLEALAGDGQLPSILADVVREYIHRRFGVSAAGRTTGELIAAAKEAGLANETAIGWHNLLDRCDLAKFARQPFSADESVELVRRAQTLLSASLLSSEESTAAKTGKVR